MDTLVRDRLRRLAPDLLRGLDGRVAVVGDVWLDVPDAPCPSDLGTLADAYDHLVVAGALWAVEDLDAVLAAALTHLGVDGMLHFLEPTHDAHLGKPLPRLRHDITGALWAAGYSVIEVHRFQVRGEWGIPWPIARGRARASRGPDSSQR